MKLADRIVSTQIHSARQLLEFEHVVRQENHHRILSRIRLPPTAGARANRLSPNRRGTDKRALFSDREPPQRPSSVPNETYREDEGDGDEDLGGYSRLTRFSVPLIPNPLSIHPK
jgi:hypothetical protein